MTHLDNTPRPRTRPAPCLTRRPGRRIGGATGPHASSSPPSDKHVRPAGAGRGPHRVGRTTARNTSKQSRWAGPANTPTFAYPTRATGSPPFGSTPRTSSGGNARDATDAGRASLTSVYNTAARTHRVCGPLTWVRWRGNANSPTPIPSPAYAQLHLGGTAALGRRCEPAGLSKKRDPRTRPPGIPLSPGCCPTGVNACPPRVTSGCLDRCTSRRSSRRAGPGIGRRQRSGRTRVRP